MSAKRPASLAAGLAAAAALQFGCAQPPVAPQRPKLEGLWRIDQAMIEPLLDRRRARLEFGADGRLNGHSGCNTLTAGYALAGDRLTLGPVVVVTRIACASLQMEQEDRILTALEKVATATVRADGLLELRGADGRGVLRGSRLER